MKDDSRASFFSQSMLSSIPILLVLSALLAPVLLDWRPGLWVGVALLIFAIITGFLMWRSRHLASVKKNTEKSQTIEFSVDAGGVIMQCEAGSTAEQYRHCPEVPGAFEGLRQLAARVGGTHILIISQPPTSEVEQAKIGWFREKDFFNRTGIPENNLIFVPPGNPAAKAFACIKYAVRRHVDDRATILREILERSPKTEAFAFCGQDSKEWRQVAHDVRERMVRADTWDGLLPLLMRSLDRQRPPRAYSA